MDDIDLDQGMDFAYSEVTPAPQTTDGVPVCSPDMQQGVPLLCANCKSNPIQIPNPTYPMPGILTPPDTPTSPFATLMKPMFPPRASEISEFALLPPSLEPLLYEPENKEERVDPNDNDFRRQHPRFDRLRSGGLKQRNKLKLRMNVGLQEALSPERNQLDSNQETEEGQAEIKDDVEVMEDEGSFIVGVELPEGEVVQKDVHGETMKLYLIGCDLRKIADQFHRTPGMDNGIGQEAALSLNVSTALTARLSVTLLCLAVGDEV